MATEITRDDLAFRSGWTHPGGVLSVTATVIDDRTVIVSGDDDGTVRLWVQPDTGAQTGQLDGHAGGVRSEAVGQISNRNVVVSGPADRNVSCGTPGAGRFRHLVELMSSRIRGPSCRSLHPGSRTTSRRCCVAPRSWTSCWSESRARISASTRTTST